MLRSAISTSALLLFTLLATASARAFTVALNPATDVSNVFLQVRDHPNPEVNEHIFPTSLPFADSHTLTLGDTSASASYTMTNEGFYISFDQVRADREEDFARSNAHVYFSVDHDVAYALEGVYSAADPSGRFVMRTSTSGT
jgi:hypothetical protein